MALGITPGKIRQVSMNEFGFSLPVERVIRSLNCIIEWRGKPTVIRVDNGPEYIRGKLMYSG
jgi:hypothetical protein